MDKALRNDFSIRPIYLNGTIIYLDGNVITVIGPDSASRAQVVVAVTAIMLIGPLRIGEGSFVAIQHHRYPT
jgi:hypothetical protein